jgi:hypothetical protein
VYKRHVQIHGKFEVLRENLFREQKATRQLLLVGFFLAFLGALKLFWR